MGIDVNTYRCRVGNFVSHCSAGVLMMPLLINFSVLIKIIGTVSFVRILLLIAGIEQNPGPTAADVQKDLIEFYMHHCKTSAMFPLFDDGNEDLLLMYKPPKMIHVDDTRRERHQIKCHYDIFYDENKSFKQIYIIGDPGVGKTTFCMHLCLMWCMAKSGKDLDEEYAHISKYDFMFYLNLRDTNYYHILDMIRQSYFEDDDDYFFVRNILRNFECCILLDGLDEWTSMKRGRSVPRLPDKVYSDNCTYITTSRPYRIENVGLARKDVDHQIHLYGILGNSVMHFNKNVLDYLNKQKSQKLMSSDFESDIREYGLSDGTNIPIIASYLMALWHDRALTDMTRSLVYANILEMFFQRAEQRKVKFPVSTGSKLQLPDSLSGLRYLNEYVSLLNNVCHLSFCSLFELDESVTNLVFTRKQLPLKPYCLSSEDRDFLCKIGLLSTNEVPGVFLVAKLRISFIHRSFLDFFAALYISSFDTSNSFTDVTKRWKYLNDVLQYQTFLLLLAGFSFSKVKKLFKNIYLTLSDDLNSCRKNALFHYNKAYYRHQIKSLQNIVVNCFKEVHKLNRCKNETFELRLEDFVFDKDSDVDVLRKLLILNSTSVKSLHLNECAYLDEFDQIKNLQCLSIVNVSSADIVKFSKCMLCSKSTLHMVSIEGDIFYKPMIPMLPVKSLHHLTSLSLCFVKMQHDSLHYLVKFLSDNVHFENINLSCVSCYDHQGDDSQCTLTLNLPKHTRISSLCLWNVNILCNNVNSSNLQSVTLWPLSDRIIRSSYIDILNCFKDSQLKHLYVDGFLGNRSDYNSMKTLTSTVKTLPCVLSLKLRHMKLPHHVLLQLHPDVTKVEVVLDSVKLSRQCFQCFIDSIVNNKSVIKVGLYQCKIRSVYGGIHRELSVEESLKYMSEYLESFPTVNTSFKSDAFLDFETTGCQ